jgi:hypothetical protein
LSDCYLEVQGLHVERTRQLRTSGDLVCWLFLYRSTMSAPISPPEGHVTVAYVDRGAGVAQLVSLEVLPHANPLAAWNLAHSALHRAAAEGVDQVVTTLDDPVLLGLGFRPGSGDLLVLRLADFD